MDKTRAPAPDGIDLTPLAPADIERLTGVGGAVQRVWRSRNLLSPRLGPHARFDVYDAASIAIRYRFALKGYPPAETQAIGEKFAPHLVWHVLLNEENTCEVLAASEKRLDEVINSFRSDEALVCELTHLTSPADAQRFLIMPEKGDLIACRDLAETIDHLRTSSCTLVDLESLAARFGVQSRGPLVTLRYDNVTRDSSPSPRRRSLK